VGLSSFPFRTPYGYGVLVGKVREPAPLPKFNSLA
jgi:hypothetical protein